MNIAVLGHNEDAVRLGMLADAAKSGLAAVARGEGEAIDGWLAYGAALNEGRALFAGDLEFGQWVADCQLDSADWKERSAAMWAAANAEQFAEARAAGNARTVRGIHAKWKELEAQREADEARAKADALRAEALARAVAEAAAREAAQAATDEAARDEAEVLAQSEGQARAKAEALAWMAEQDAVLAEKRAEGPRLKERVRDWQEAHAAQPMPPAAHVAHNSGNNEWYTPAEFVEAAREVLGRFDLDPASSEIANRTVQAARIFTEEDDGLQQDWPVGNIWMNPPYAQPLMGQFADKFAAEVRRGSNGIVLVNNATETAWFQTIAAECSAVCFPKGRIRFLDPDGNQGAPLQGQAIIYCGPAPEDFAQAFAGFGLVVLHG